MFLGVIRSINGDGTVSVQLLTSDRVINMREEDIEPVAPLKNDKFRVSTYRETKWIRGKQDNIKQKKKI